MASKKRIEANRLNAQRSTGPRTSVGKRWSSMNSRKHGLYARFHVPGVDKHLSRCLWAGLTDYEKTIFPCWLLDVAAGAYSRLLRAVAYEEAVGRGQSARLCTLDSSSSAGLETEVFTPDELETLSFNDQLKWWREAQREIGRFLHGMLTLMHMARNRGTDDKRRAQVFRRIVMQLSSPAAKSNFLGPSPKLIARYRRAALRELWWCIGRLEELRITEIRSPYATKS